MKFLISFALLPTLLCAQVTLEISDFSDGGDTIRVSSTNDFSIDFESTGTNYNWDFSSLVAESQTLKDYQSMNNAGSLTLFTFGGFANEALQATNFSETAGIPLDQAGDFLPISIDAVNQFSKNSSDAINSVGLSISISGTEIPVASDTIETRYNLPLNYGNIHNSRGYTYLNLNPIYDAIWIQYRTRDTEVDGWGSITTPYGTFDALRLKHEIVEIDSIYIDLFGGPAWYELPVPLRTEYEWIAKDEKEPILRIITSQIAGAETVNSIEYRDQYLGLEAGIIESQNNIVIGPNPVENKLNILGVNGTYSFSLLSLNGKVVVEKVNITNKSIDLSNIEKGTYLIVLNTTKGVSVQKIIKH
ncbi:MAG: T9SS type A sorting domain-containing protein [Crocinitomicaceae bacterium]|tara:strand:- start:539 stop:1618 length:1080 start_codon:yes stop_codon:yes gene_type:complete